MTSTRDLVQDERDQFAFHDDIVYLRETKRGLTRDTVEEISRFKDEPDWMLQYRLRAYDHFVKRKMPNWGGDLGTIDFDKIVYYRKPSEREEKSWDDVPEQIKKTFEKLGIPEAERKFLAGVGAQYDSEVVYHSVREELSKIGVVFMGTDQALKEYPEIFRKYFGTVVPAEDNKFAALNAAVWSGGSFVYVPKGVEVPLPLQAYFRINGENTGQFERTLIVVDEGAKVHYIEGCTAPIYATDSLHAAVVEVVALAGSKVRYTTIQNWSNDVYNLVTKRAARVRARDGRVGGREHRLRLTGDSRGRKNNDLLPISVASSPGDHVYSLTTDFDITRSRVIANTARTRPRPSSSWCFRTIALFVRRRTTPSWSLARSGSHASPRLAPACVDRSMVTSSRSSASFRITASPTSSALLLPVPTSPEAVHGRPPSPRTTCCGSSVLTWATGSPIARTASRSRSRTRTRHANGCARRSRDLFGLDATRSARDRASRRVSIPARLADSRRALPAMR